MLCVVLFTFGQHTGDHFAERNYGLVVDIIAIESKRRILMQDGEISHSLNKGGNSPAAESRLIQ